MIKLAAFDIDGTILPHGQKHLDDITIDMFRKLKEKGITTVLCTGRTLSTIGDMINIPNIDYFIGANGAVVYDVNNQKLINEVNLSFKETKSIFDFCKINDIELSVSTRDSEYFQSYEGLTENWFWKHHVDLIKPLHELDINEERIHQITVWSNHELVSNKIKVHLETIDCLAINSSWEKGIFLSKTGVNKAEGLKSITKVTGIKLKNMIAFGDGTNDFEMLNEVGYGVAMGVAGIELKAVANDVIGNVEEHAVLKKLKNMNLI